MRRITMFVDRRTLIDAFNCEPVIGSYRSSTTYFLFQSTNLLRYLYHYPYEGASSTRKLDINLLFDHVGRIVDDAVALVLLELLRAAKVLT